MGQIRGGVHRKHKSRGNQQQDIRCEPINQEVPQGLVGRVGQTSGRVPGGGGDAGSRGQEEALPFQGSPGGIDSSPRLARLA